MILIYRNYINKYVFITTEGEFEENTDINIFICPSYNYEKMLSLPMSIKCNLCIYKQVFAIIPFKARNVLRPHNENLIFWSYNLIELLSLYFTNNIETDITLTLMYNFGVNVRTDRKILFAKD